MKAISASFYSRFASTILAAIVLLIVSDLAAQSNCVSAPSGLVSWWRAEDDATDNSGANHGTLINGATYAAGQVGRGFSLNGSSQYVDIPSSASLQLSNEFTIEFWAKRTASGFFSYIGKRHQNSGSEPCNFGWNGDSGSMFLYFLDPALGGFRGTTCPVPPVGEFHHLAGSYRQASATHVELKVFVDGQLVKTELVEGNLARTVNNYTVKIGADTATGYFLTGVIDEVSIYGRALTTNEVQAIYQAGAFGKCVQVVPPAIAVQPADQSVAVGQNAGFSVGATGTAPLAYQWLREGTNVAGATSSTLQLVNVQLSDAGNYSVIVSNSAGTVTSSNAVLSVVPVAPFITTQPVDQVVAEGGTVSFSVVAGGTPPLSYQWSFNASPITDATNATLVLTGVTTNQAGLYAVGVTNAYGDIVSSNATLAVIVLGTNLFDDFEPNIDPLQWSGFGGTVLATNYGGYVSPTHSLWFGGSGSRFATTRPLNTTGGGMVQFYIRFARGTSSIWESTDLPMEGVVVEYSTNASLWTEMARYNTPNYTNWTQVAVIAPVGAQSSQTQFRWRQLSNSGPNNDHWALDDISILTGPAAPAIISQPQSRTAFVGATVNFNVTATGSAPLSYQWTLNGTNIAAATASVLTLTNVQLSDAGAYSVEVSNSTGAVTSSNALLTVNTPPPCANAPTGLIGLWRGESNTVDQVGGNNGTLINGATYATGKVGQGFSLNGSSQFVQVPDSASLSLSNEFTIEFWSKRTASGNFSYIGKRHPTSGSVPCNFGWNGNNSTMFLYFLDSALPGFRGTTCPVPSIGDFHHLAGSFRQANATNVELRVFVDGQLVKTEMVQGNLARSVNNLPMTIGADNPTGYFLTGVIDEVSIYNRVLTTNEVQAIFNAGTLGKCSDPIAPSITSQPANQTVTVGQSAIFTVNAGGTAPLAYQWRFNGTNIADATNSSLTLSNVLASQAGNYSVVVTNSVGSATSSNAVLSVNFPPAVVRVVSTNVASGDSVVVPIVLVANGNENALGFSLNFSPSILTYVSASLGGGLGSAALFVNDTQTGSGKLGLALSLPAEGTFSSGTQQVIYITFNAAVMPSNSVTSITFGDSPIARQLSDPLGNALPATYDSGTSGITAVEFEGDVSPRPNGDRLLTITDWVLAGRYAAQLDSPTNAMEYQRADCAPRDTLGNGAITVSDWVQAGRYAAGLDPATPVGGPTSAGIGPSFSMSGAKPIIGPSESSTLRQVRVLNAALASNQSGVLRVDLDSQGDENALGFSLGFDPSMFTYQGVTLGANASGAALNVNTNQLAAGRLGFVVALSAGNHFSAGSHEVVKVTLRAGATTTNGCPLAFGNQPVPREISDATAHTLVADYVNGTISVNPPPSLNVARSAQGITLFWPLWASNFVPQLADSISPTLWTNVSQSVVVVGNENTVILPATGTARFYRLISQ